MTATGPAIMEVDPGSVAGTAVDRFLGIQKNILIVIWQGRARASLTQNCVARLQGKSHQEHHHHLAATGQYYWSKCLSLRRHPATGLLQMYPETRAMDDPYDIHSRGFSDHSAVIAEVALSCKSIGTLIIPEWHIDHYRDVP